MRPESVAAERNTVMGTCILGAIINYVNDLTEYYTCTCGSPVTNSKCFVSTASYFLVLKKCMV